MPRLQAIERALLAAPANEEERRELSRRAESAPASWNVHALNYFTRFATSVSIARSAMLRVILIYVNDRLKSASIAFAPLSRSVRVPVPVKCWCVMTGADAASSACHSSPVHCDQPSRSWSKT